MNGTDCVQLAAGPSIVSRSSAPNNAFQQQQQQQQLRNLDGSGQLRPSPTGSLVTEPSDSDSPNLGGGGSVMMMDNGGGGGGSSSSSLNNGAAKNGNNACFILATTNNNNNNGMNSGSGDNLHDHRISAVQLQSAVLSAISELERLQNGGVSGKSSPPVDSRYLEVTKDKPIKLQVKVVVPVKDYPKFNFVGKLLGPKGNSLKRLQEDTLTKMAILGRGSMRDKAKEEELRKMNDPKFAHLNEDLHVEISTFAPPAEAYARISHAMSEIKRFLVPDYNDDIRQDQLRELAYINGGVTTAPPQQASLPPPLTRRTGALPPPPAQSQMVAATAVRTTRIGLLATPPVRALAPRPGVLPPPPMPGRTLLRTVPPPSRTVAYRKTSVVDSRLRSEDDYVFDDSYGYADPYDQGDTYYEYTHEPTPALADPYSDEFVADFGANEDWRLGSESSRLKAPTSRPTARASFRDHPYAPPPPSSTQSPTAVTPRF